MKRLWLGAGLLLGMLAFPAAAMADTASTQLFLNGKPLAAEVPPRIVNGNTLVPIRVIAENLGAKVSWDEHARQVTVTRGATKLILTIDKPEVSVNGTKMQLEVAPAIVDGSTMLPLRFVGEQLGVKVTWDELTRSVFLYKKADDAAGTAAGGSGASGGIAGAGSGGAGGTAGGGSAAGGTAAGGAAAGGTAAGGAAAGGAAAGTGPAQTPGGTPGVAYAADPDGGKPGVVQGIEFAGGRLTIKTSGAATKPNLFHLSNPERIVLDVPYTVLDDGLKAKMTGSAGEIAVEHPVVQKIRFSNYSSEPSTVRIIIDLKARAELQAADAKQQQAGQFVYDLKTSKYRVVIDAGHGGKDSGAISITNKMEKTFTLAMATKVYELLQKEPLIEPLMTRSDDTFVELDDRVAFANTNDADLFLSIHGNKYTPSTSGTETYYYRDESLDFAKTIHKHLIPAAGLPDRGIRQEPFRVVKGTTMPAVLVEVGYLSNKNDEQKMFDDAFQNQVAASLVAAIKDYLNIQ
jgi:N-acetylmuramoyl-L-alanine amidase